MTGFILLPLVQAVILSFTATVPTDLVTEGTLGLMNYRDTLAAPELRAAMLNSLIYALAWMIGLFLRACAAALARPLYFAGIVLSVVLGLLVTTPEAGQLHPASDW